MLAIDRRKIVYKIILGYLLALSLVVGIVIFSLSRLDDIKASVNDITSRLSVTRSLSQSITAKIRLVRFYGERYRRFYHQEDLDQFNTSLQDVKDGLQGISKQMYNDEWLEMVRYIQQQTGDYEKEFDKIAELIMYQQSLLSTVFLKQELLIENQLSAIRINVGIVQAPEIFFSFGNARNSFQLMRLYQSKYLQEADERYYVMFKNNYRYASRAFGDLNRALQKASGDSRISSNAIKANEELTVYYDTFLLIREAGLAQKKSSRELDHHELEITDTAAEISAAIEEEYRIRNDLMEKLVLRTQIELVVAFIIAAVLSLWVIFIISRKITAPIFQEMQREAEEIKIARDKAEVANRVKSEFLANMSHELRTPLNAVIGFSELLASMPLDERQRGFVGAIHTSGQGLLRLINDILDLSKIEAGKVALNPSTVNFRGVFEEIEHIFSFKVQEKLLTLSIHHSPDIPEFVEMDEIRLRQILLNLIGNAIKFTEEGAVTVETSCACGPGETVDLFIAVSDTGIGITTEDQEKVFNSFEQQSNQDPNKYEGTGLGLSITRQLVELMHGTIVLASTAGEGSRFEVTLPRVSVAAAPAGRTPAIAPGHDDATAVANEPVPVADDITIEGVADTRLLVSQLEEDIIPVLHALKKAFVISDFAAMSENLARIGNQHNLSYLSEFAFRVEQLIDAFDIKGMNDSIQRLAEIVEEVVETVEKSGAR